MRTTTRGLYALKAVLVLAAESSEQSPLALHKIAERESISAEFLQQIFFRLRKAGLISAYRGPGGGFFLTKPMDEISVLDILEAAGESLALSPCYDEEAGQRVPCSQFCECSAGDFWMSLEREVRRFAQEKKLADLLRKAGSP
ncbi:MAG: Rrf2 family transcriptional regulator [Spirochaetota bacterium]